MMVVDSEASSTFWHRAVAWPRVRNVLITSILLGPLLSANSKTAAWITVPRVMIAAFLLMLVFTLFESHPRRLPTWFARWALQVIGVVVAVPFVSMLAYTLTSFGAPPVIGSQSVPLGFSQLAMMGIVFAPWVVVAAIVRQREDFAREQAHAFELARSELEHKALDAQLRLLQAQVTPHFLFNTLANVQALVNAGSPRAAEVLDSLITYLRAAVPRLGAATSTFADEVTMVQAYLNLMQLRMPDRLLVSIYVDPAARSLECPPMTLLTLVENAVRHGIDPSETGGRIDVRVERRSERCYVCVQDTGVGLGVAAGGLGTGLKTLRERLRLRFNGDADVRLSVRHEGGVCAEIDLPARTLTS